MTAVFGVSIGTTVLRMARTSVSRVGAGGALTFDKREIDAVGQVPATLIGRAVSSVTDGQVPAPRVAVTHAVADDVGTVLSEVDPKALPSVIPVLDTVASAEFVRASNLTSDTPGAVVVFDLGASGLTLSLVEIPSANVLGSSRTTEISGNTFDDLVLDHLVAEGILQRPDGPEAAAEVARFCRGVKESLSTSTKAQTPGGGIVLMTREQLVRAMDPALERAADLVGELGAGNDRTIDRIVLIGGGAYIPSVQTVLAGRLSLPVVVPDEPEMVVAKGAALIAGGFGHTEADDATPPGSPTEPPDDDEPVFDIAGAEEKDRAEKSAAEKAAAEDTADDSGQPAVAVAGSAAAAGVAAATGFAEAKPDGSADPKADPGSAAEDSVVAAEGSASEPTSLGDVVQLPAEFADDSADGESGIGDAVAAGNEDAAEEALTEETLAEDALAEDALAEDAAGTPEAGGAAESVVTAATSGDSDEVTSEESARVSPTVDADVVPAAAESADGEPVTDPADGEPVTEPADGEHVDGEAVAEDAATVVDITADKPVEADVDGQPDAPVAVVDEQAAGDEPAGVDELAEDGAVSAKGAGDIGVALDTDTADTDTADADADDAAALDTAAVGGAGAETEAADEGDRGAETATAGAAVSVEDTSAAEDAAAEGHSDEAAAAEDAVVDDVTANDAVAGDLAAESVTADDLAAESVTADDVVAEGATVEFGATKDAAADSAAPEASETEAEDRAAGALEPETSAGPVETDLGDEPTIEVPASMTRAVGRGIDGPTEPISPDDRPNFSTLAGAVADQGSPAGRESADDRGTAERGSAVDRGITDGAGVSDYYAPLVDPVSNRSGNGQLLADPATETRSETQSATGESGSGKPIAGAQSRAARIKARLPMIAGLVASALAVGSVVLWGLSDPDFGASGDRFATDTEIGVNLVGGGVYGVAAVTLEPEIATL